MHRITLGGCREHRYTWSPRGKETGLGDGMCVVGKKGCRQCEYLHFLRLIQVLCACLIFQFLNNSIFKNLVDFLVDSISNSVNSQYLAGRKD